MITDLVKITFGQTFLLRFKFDGFDFDLAFVQIFGTKELAPNLNAEMIDNYIRNKFIFDDVNHKMMLRSLSSKLQNITFIFHFYLFLYFINIFRLSFHFAYCWIDGLWKWLFDQQKFEYFSQFDPFDKGVGKKSVYLRNQQISTFWHLFLKIYPRFFDILIIKLQTCWDNTKRVSKLNNCKF